MKKKKKARTLRTSRARVEETSIFLSILIIFIFFIFISPRLSPPHPPRAPFFLRAHFCPGLLLLLRISWARSTQTPRSVVVRVCLRAWPLHTLSPASHRPACWFVIMMIHSIMMGHLLVGSRGGAECFSSVCAAAVAVACAPHRQNGEGNRRSARDAFGGALC